MGNFTAPVKRFFHLIDQTNNVMARNKPWLKEAAFVDITQLIGKRLADLSFNSEKAFQDACAIAHSDTEAQIFAAIDTLVSTINENTDGGIDLVLRNQVAALFQSRHWIGGPAIPHGAQKLIAFLWVINRCRNNGPILNTQNEFDFDSFRSDLPPRISRIFLEKYFREAISDARIYNPADDQPVNAAGFCLVQLGRDRQHYRSPPMIVATNNGVNSPECSSALELIGTDESSAPATLEVNTGKYWEVYCPNGYAYVRAGARKEPTKQLDPTGAARASQNRLNGYHTNDSYLRLLEEIDDQNIVQNLDRKKVTEFSIAIHQNHLQDSFIPPLNGGITLTSFSEIFYQPSFQKPDEKLLTECTAAKELPGPQSWNEYFAALHTLHTATRFSCATISKEHFIFNVKNGRLVNANLIKECAVENPQSGFEPTENLLKVNEMLSKMRGIYNHLLIATEYILTRSGSRHVKPFLFQLEKKMRFEAGIEVQGDPKKNAYKNIQVTVTNLVSREHYDIMWEFIEFMHAKPQTHDFDQVRDMFEILKTETSKYRFFRTTMNPAIANTLETRSDSTWSNGSSRNRPINKLRLEPGTLSINPGESTKK